MRYWSDPWNISDKRTALEQRSWWHSASYSTRKKMNEFSQKMFVDVLDKLIILKCVMIGLYGMVILIYVQVEPIPIIVAIVSACPSVSADFCSCRKSVEIGDSDVAVR